jgi:anaerobic selenocysteine-containing dehydrogenase/ferredoxin-NADP reductase
MKGRSAAELVDNPERLRYPMKRTQPKGSADPGWQAISWDEALDEIAARLLSVKEQSGAHAVAFGITTPNGTPICDSSEWIERFIYTFGSPNICYAAEICNWHKEIGHSLTYGCGMPAPDYINSDLIILWGHNPTNTWLAQAHSISEARKAGAKMIVIDPRDTALAREADVWLRVRPGADAALAMGLANGLLAGDRYDRKFIQQWSNGPFLVRDDTGALLRGADIGQQPTDGLVYWNDSEQALGICSLAPGKAIPPAAALEGRYGVVDTSGKLIACQTAFELYKRACAPYGLGETAKLTWIEIDALSAAIALIGTSKRIALHSWTGVEQHNNATQSARAISCLYALTGCFDKEGGNRIFGSLNALTVNDLELLDPAQLKKSLGSHERPIGPAANGWVSSKELYRAILHSDPYKVRALMSFGGNLLLSQADTAMAVESFKSLEFHVHCDLFMNPTAEFADIVLPVNTPWEREALRIGFGITTRAQEWVQLRQQMVTVRYDTRSDADIVFALACRMGMESSFFDGSRENAWNAMLAPLGLSADELRKSPAGIRVPIEHPTQKYRSSGFATHSGVVELYSEQLHVLGQGALPSFHASHILQPSKEFPYVLSSAKSGYFCHSQHRQVSSLRKKSKYPTIELSDALASEHGIAEGDWVKVTTRSGVARFKAKLNPQLHPKVVFGEHGWWQSCTPLGAPGMPFAGPTNSNYNGLIDATDKDPVSGSIPLRAFTCRIERELGASQAPARWSDFKDFYVSQAVSEGHDVTRVHLRPVDGGLLPGYEVGQHIAIRVVLRSGLQVIRAYSLVGIASTSATPEYVICVRNSQAEDVDEPINPSVSHHINRHLVVGEAVELQPPGGRFTIPVHGTRPLIFHAGGIGITPFITALETAAVQRSTARFLLLYGNRNLRVHIFKDRLQYLKTRLPGLSVVDVYSRPGEGETPDHRGYVSVDHIPPMFMQDRPLHYMCGAEPMMDMMTDALLKAGVPRHDIFKEAFTSTVDTSKIPTGSFNITFMKSGRTEKWCSDKGSVLDFCDRLGLSLPSGCRVGQCESCAVRIVKGQVLHLQGHPDEADVCLTCQAIPLTDITIDA